MRKIELLAPAGSWEALEAAVKAGADAIYLAGQQFGARKSALNFTDEALVQAIRYCHLRGVRVYLTVNTLLGDQELPQLEAFLTPLYEAGMDAFIVQDLGVFQYMRDLYPDMEIHCSTQMALHTAADLAAVKALGASRVVLPREMSVEMIKAVHEAVDIELEVFVHGALCVSVSGQCLMSSLIGGRSGNRGSCAQSCRQKYKLLKGQGEEKVISKDGDYLLSPRDLMTIDQLGDIVEAGATSLKIEGRMKGPEYSYAVTRAYRLALDAVLNKTVSGSEAETDAPQAIALAKEEIRRIFNRDFTTGFILNTGNKDFASQSTPGNRGILLGEVVSYDKRNGEMILKLFEDISKGDDLQVRSQGQSVGGRVEYLVSGGKRVETAAKDSEILVNFKHEVAKGTQVYRTYDQQLMKQLQQQINDAQRTTGVTLKYSMEAGKPLSLELIHESGKSICVFSEAPAEVALKTPLSNERISEQLEKTGGTPYRVTALDIQRQGNETIAIKALNQLRREGLEALSEALEADWKRPVPQKLKQPGEIASETTLETEENRFSDSNEKMRLTAMVRTAEQLVAAAGLGVKEIYIHNMFDVSTAIWLELQDNYPEVKLIPYMGRFVYDALLDQRIEVLKNHQDRFDTVLVSSLGQLNRLKQAGFSVIADYSLNAFNHKTCEFLRLQGAKETTLSLELNGEQIEALLEVQLPKGQQFELVGYGKIPVMVNQYCPINGVYSQDKAGCQICRKDQFYLEDKTGAKFLVKGDAHCQVELFNSAVLNLADEWHVLESMGIASYRLNFVDENQEEVTEVIETHIKAALNFPIELRAKGYTKGHFKRGVL